MHQKLKPFAHPSSPYTYLQLYCISLLWRTMLQGLPYHSFWEKPIYITSAKGHIVNPDSLTRSWPFCPFTLIYPPGGLWRTLLQGLLYQGRIQDFLKERAPKLRTDRTSAPVGTGGVWGGCAPSEAEKNCSFQSQFARVGAFFLPDAPTQSQAPYLCKKRGGERRLRPPL